MSDGTKSGSELKSIPIGDVVPNDYNPNRMPEEEFEEYVAEVKHLGRLSKPIVVRRRSDGKFEIIDGQHGQKAAQKLGFGKVLCEILGDVDDVEAMRQTYKRNRSGKDNNVLLGRMFQEMEKKGKLSTRKLAETISVPESTIRGKQRYARVADQRSEYAGEDRTDEVAKLTVKQVELCAQLPPEFVNKWLDSGGNIGDILPEPDACPYTVTMPLQEADLFDVLQSECWEFARSLRYASGLAEWYTRHQLLPEVKKYVKAVGKLRLPVEVLDHLPIHGPSSDRTSQIALSLADWKAALGQCKTGAGNAAGIIPLVEAAVRVTLREAGVDPTTVFSPVIIEIEQQLTEAPASIRDAKFLTLEEKHCLFSLVNEASEETVVAEDLALEATQATLELIRVDRMGNHEGVRRRGAPSADYVSGVFYGQLSKIRDEASRSEQDDHFADDQALLDGIIAYLCDTSAIEDATIGGQPAAEVLSDRLRGLDKAEFHLIASLVLSNDAVDDACSRWLLAMGGEVQEDTDLEEES